MPTLIDQSFGSILNASMDAAVVADREGRITAWNRIAQATFGWSELEAQRHRVNELFVDESAKDGSRQIETKMRRRDRSTFPAALCSAPVKDGTVYFIRNTTLARRRDNEHQAFEQLQRRFSAILAAA